MARKPRLYQLQVSSRSECTLLLCRNTRSPTLDLNIHLNTSASSPMGSLTGSIANAFTSSGCMKCAYRYRRMKQVSGFLIITDTTKTALAALTDLIITPQRSSIMNMKLITYRYGRIYTITARKAATPVHSHLGLQQ